MRYILLFLILGMFSCTKNDPTPENEKVSDNLNLMGVDWNAFSISIGEDGRVYGIVEIDNLREDAYELHLYEDSTFKIRTSVNTFQGTFDYSTESKSISFNTLGGTKVGQGDAKVREVDSILMEVFYKTNSYDFVENELELNGSLGSISFK